MSLASESKFLLEKFIQKRFCVDYLTPSVPFRLFKNVQLPKELSNSKICLPLNRFTDPLALSSSCSKISVWSQSHLKFLRLLDRTKFVKMQKVILKNPYKTENLIQESIRMGLRTMVVDNFQELWKIHQQIFDQIRCRCLSKTQGFQYVPLNFLWRVSDFQGDLNQIETLKTYHIKLGGLVFAANQALRITQVKKFIEKANSGLCDKRKIRAIYLEAESDGFNKIQDTYFKDEFFLKNKIEIILEKIDFTMTDKCWIAAKVIGERRKREFVLNEQAYNYISPEQVRKGEMVQHDGRKWILSLVSYFPDVQLMEAHDRKGYIMSIN